MPLGVLLLATGLLTLIFGHGESSDFWVDALQLALVDPRRDRFPLVCRLVMYLDNGPNHSGVRRQFLKRLVEFADGSGLAVRLVYYPPYHSKYNPIERYGSSLQKKWNGVPLTCLSVVMSFARRMTRNGQTPAVQHLDGQYPDGVTVSNSEMKQLNHRLVRSTTLPKYDLLIQPKQPRRR